MGSKSDVEIGKLAADDARSAVLEECKKAKLTLRKSLIRIAQGLDAKVIKTHFSPESGWEYSKPLTDHPTRLKAADMALVVLDAKPSEKHTIEPTDLVIKVVQFGKEGDGTDA